MVFVALMYHGSSGLGRREDDMVEGKSSLGGCCAVTGSPPDLRWGVHVFVTASSSLPMSTPVPQMTRKWRRELERRLKNNLVVHEYQWHMRWDGDLFEWERWWAQLQPRIAAAGYDLRPRYHPGWTPSWLGIVGLWRNPMDCPDWTEMIKVRKG